MKITSERQVQFSRFKDFRTSSERARTRQDKKATTSDAKNTPYNYSAKLKAQRFRCSAAVVRLPLTTETQIQSRSTHTLHPVTHTCTHRRILAHATHTSTNRRIITHSHLQLKLRSFPTELFNLFFSRNALCTHLQRVSPCDY